MHTDCWVPNWHKYFGITDEGSPVIKRYAEITLWNQGIAKKQKQRAALLFVFSLELLTFYVIFSGLTNCKYLALVLTKNKQQVWKATNGKWEKTSSDR